MAHFSSALSASLSNTHNELRHVNMPFSEHDSMVLQDMFLTPGLHSITVDSPEKGRQIIQTIVQSLACYSAVAAFSLTNHDFAQLPKSDVCAHVYEYVMNKELNDDFFDGYYDFIWIETTSALLTTTWCLMLEQKLIEIAKNRSVSIVIVAS